jgi:gliding motility-associated-like protein
MALNYASPDEEGSLIINLQPNANGVAQIDVTVEDDGPTSINNITMSFDLNITPVSDPPAIVSSPDTLVAPGGIYTYVLQATDPDTNDQLTFALLNAPDWLNLSDNNDGTAIISGTAPANGSSFLVVVEVRDLVDSTDTQIFTLYLNEPPFVSDSEIEVNEDLVYTFATEDFSAYYSDNENDNMVSIKLIDLPANGNVLLNQTNVQEGQVINTADLTALTYIPQQNFNGDDNIIWQANDGVSLSNNAKITILVTPVNDPPSLANIENTPLAYKQGSGPALLTETITISDIDDSSIQGGAISFLENYLDSEDMLIFEDTDSIKGRFDSVTGIMLLEGSDSKSSYEQAFRSINYINTNLDNTSTAERVITFIVWDFVDSSNIQNRSIMIEQVKPEPDFIDAFTPNDDGVNDIWEIRKISAYSSVDVSIYDSKGLLIYRTDNYLNEPWNGKRNGNVLSAGAYFYKVILDGGERIFEGNVNILK